MRVAELSQTHCLREEVTNDRKPAIISAKQSFFSYSGTTSPVARASRRFRMHATLDTSRPTIGLRRNRKTRVARRLYDEELGS